MGIVKNSLMVLEEIGRENGLSGEKLDRYVQYIWARWPENIEKSYERSYLGEWARRFKNETEYQCSDDTGIKVLRIIDANSYMKVI